MERFQPGARAYRLRSLRNHLRSLPVTVTRWLRRDPGVEEDGGSQLLPQSVHHLSRVGDGASEEPRTLMELSKVKQEWLEDPLCSWSHPDTDVILMCFSIDSPGPLENKPASRIAEVRPCCPNVPIISAGREMELRKNPRTLTELAKVKQEWLEDPSCSVSHPDTDVILMCFSIDSPSPLENEPASRRAEVRHFCPNVPIISAGRETDFRKDPCTLTELAKVKQEWLEDPSCSVSHPDTDVILMCFSIDSPGALENKPASWRAEARHFCPNVPIISAGKETDLRKDSRTLTELSKVKQEWLEDPSCSWSHPDTDVILMCFSIDSPGPLENKPASRIAEVRPFCPNVPIISAWRETELRKNPRTLTELAKVKQEWLEDPSCSVSHPDTDVILMCFSIDSPGALENKPASRRAEARHFCPNVPIISAGRETDLFGMTRALFRKVRVLRREPGVEEDGGSQLLPQSVHHLSGVGGKPSEDPRTMTELAKAKQEWLDDPTCSPSHPDPDVILMCFSIDSPDSLENNSGVEEG
ncbi:hypothetical protein MTO96_013139 [Rhipicephalus appendiculatus]